MLWSIKFRSRYTLFEFADILFRIISGILFGKDSDTFSDILSDTFGYFHNTFGYFSGMYTRQLKRICNLFPLAYWTTFAIFWIDLEIRPFHFLKRID